jgi:hypothetical protein
MVAVAQLVESRIVIPVVAGSSPVSHPREFKQKAQSSDWAFCFLTLGFLYSVSAVAGRRAKRIAWFTPASLDVLDFLSTVSRVAPSRTFR